MSNELLIRKAKLSDKKELAELYSQFWDAHKNLKDLNPLFKCGFKPTLSNFIKDAVLTLKDKESHTYVAIEDNHVVGYIYFYFHKNTPWYKVRKYVYVDECVVDKNHRSKGIAKKLFSRLFKICKSKNIKYIELRTALNNTLAEKAWSSLGFKKHAFEWVRKI